MWSQSWEDVLPPQAWGTGSILGELLPRGHGLGAGKRLQGPGRGSGAKARMKGKLCPAPQFPETWQLVSRRWTGQGGPRELAGTSSA